MFTHLEFLNLTRNRNRNLKPTEESKSKSKTKIKIKSPSVLATLLGESNRVPQSLRFLRKCNECCSKL